VQNSSHRTRAVPAPEVAAPSFIQPREHAALFEGAMLKMSTAFVPIGAIVALSPSGGSRA